MTTVENYVKEAKTFFDETHSVMTVDNHSEHNPNPDYWDFLLGEIKRNPDKWRGKHAFDFGCGCGRNLKNLADLASWSSLHGCDISRHNANFAYDYAQEYNLIGANIRIWESDGVSIKSMDGLMPVIKYDFIMSTIVLEHIPSWTIRYMILKSIYEHLNEEGQFSLSLSDLSTTVDYHVDHFKFPMNGKINNPDAMKKDLLDIGFKDVEISIGKVFQERDWSYVKAYK